jgi:hypothetical protein
VVERSGEKRVNATRLFQNLADLPIDFSNRDVARHPRMREGEFQGEGKQTLAPVQALDAQADRARRSLALG